MQLITYFTFVFNGSDILNTFSRDTYPYFPSSHWYQSQHHCGDTDQDECGEKATDKIHCGNHENRQSHTETEDDSLKCSGNQRLLKN